MAKYSDYTEQKKKLFAREFAERLYASLFPDPTNSMVPANEAGVDFLINQLRAIGLSELVNEISNQKDLFPQGLRETIKDRFGGKGETGREKLRLNALGFASDQMVGLTEQEQIAMASGVDVSESNFAQFGKLPEGTTFKRTSVLSEEGDIPSAYNTKVKPDRILKAGEDIEGPPREAQFYKPTAEQLAARKAADKAEILKTERDKQAALAGTEGPYGYRGGYEQFLRDQQILAPTALGKRERDGSFRLRTPSEVQARIRQGQFNIQQPKREALQRFRDRFGGFQQERKQFMEDTGEDPLEVEKRTTAGQQQMAAQAAGERERQKREMLDKQFKVQEPPEFTSEFAKDVEGLSPTEKAEVMRMVKEKEEEKNKMLGI
tara:strand:- start:448 stop:1578 length:1131 start_codon:yes stop_codon:yes gene_type:complete